MKDNIERLLLLNFNRLGRLAMYLTSNPQDAQDLFQETAVRVLINGEKFALGTDFNAWSGRIMTNLFISHIKTKRRRHELGKQGNILNKLYGGMDSLGSESVACMTKHWPGGGPQEKGDDAHFRYGMNQVYPGKNFDYHLIPFEGAFKAHTAAIMPYYGVPVGQTSEDVGMSFNKEIITDLLRKKHGYDGVVCTDWGILQRVWDFGLGIGGSQRPRRPATQRTGKNQKIHRSGR